MISSLNMQGKGYWNRLKAGWYRRGLDYSNFPKTALSFILPKTKDSKTFLDVGAGCGTLSIPLAKAGKKVTALDPSPAMIEILKEDLRKEKIKSVKTITATWEESRKTVKPHDVMLCANVPYLLSDPAPFIEDARRLARKKTFIIENADPQGDKFYYKEIYPLLFNKPFGVRGDYLKTYTALHDMGIFANVEIIEYDFNQPFDSLKEAVEFWKEYLGIVTEEHDRKLEGFLKKRLVKKGKLLMAGFHKKSAVIWWGKE